MNLKKE